jgi:signal transduction histidine kinase
MNLIRAMTPEANTAEVKVQEPKTPEATAQAATPTPAAIQQPTPTPTTAAELIAEFRNIPILSDLPEDGLRWLADHALEYDFQPGDVMIKEGAAADAMIIYLEGESDGRRESLGPDSPVYTARAGAVTGMLPFSRMTNYNITARAVTKTRVARIPKEHFPEMLNRIPELGPRLVGILSDRVREATKQDLAREKLASLGKLSAGLAHELNNPAAAASRAASMLRAVFEKREQASMEIDIENLSPDARAMLRVIESKAREIQLQTKPKNALELSDQQQELQAWLEAHDVDDAWDLAAILAEADVKVEKLDHLSEKFSSPKVIGAVIRRFGATLEISRLIADIEHSTCRISDLVRAIKEYSFMDQAPRQEVDVAKGLDSTLIMLTHKLKHGIIVTRDYDPDLPRIPSYGSELNQVWTNLIDNAADAMNGRGEIKIRTMREGDDVLVEIVDNGPGIPLEIQTRIFEPFFTTKPMGQGTGLGLDTVYRIVRKHRGNVTFASRPGYTCFRVRLPIENTRL